MNCAPTMILKKLPKAIKATLQTPCLVLGLVLPSAVFAAPVGGQTVSGQVTINQSGQLTHIHQSTQKAILNWDSFNIAAQETVQFLQPSASAIALNRVTNGNPTQILGQLKANGQVFLVNTSGVFFGANARVDVAGLVASTLDIHNADFLAGDLRFARAGLSAAEVVNLGELTAAEHGYVILAGDFVDNQGIIQAQLGTVGLVAGQRLTLDMQGDGLVSFAIDGAAVGALAGVKNGGTLRANGGTVVMTAEVAADLAATAVQNDGLIQAQSIVEHQGEIFLAGIGGDTFNRGELTVAALDDTVDGGLIQVLGERVALLDGSILEASGQNGGEIRVGGDFQGLGETQTASRTHVAANVSLKADALSNGHGGKVIVWSDETTKFFGDISATGGSASGDGGFVEVSGKQDLLFAGSVDASAANGENGTLLLDPDVLTVSSTGTLDAILSGNQQILFTDGGANETVSSSTIVTLLDGGTNVLLQATDLIDFVDPVFASGTGDLSLQSKKINFNGFGVNIGGVLDIFIFDAIAGAPSAVNDATLLLGTNLQAAEISIQGSTVEIGSTLASDIAANIEFSPIRIFGDSTTLLSPINAFSGSQTLTIQSGVIEIQQAIILNGGELFLTSDTALNVSADLGSAATRLVAFKSFSQDTATFSGGVFTSGEIFINTGGDIIVAASMNSLDANIVFNASGAFNQSAGRISSSAGGIAVIADNVNIFDLFASGNIINAPFANSVGIKITTPGDVVIQNLLGGEGNNINIEMTASNLFVGALGVIELGGGFKVPKSVTINGSVAGRSISVDALGDIIVNAGGSIDGNAAVGVINLFADTDANGGVVNALGALSASAINLAGSSISFNSVSVAPTQTIVVPAVDDGVDGGAADVVVVVGEPEEEPEEEAEGEGSPLDEIEQAGGLPEQDEVLPPEFETDSPFDNRVLDGSEDEGGDELDPEKEKKEKEDRQVVSEDDEPDSLEEQEIIQLVDGDNALQACVP